MRSHLSGILGELIVEVISSAIIKDMLEEKGKKNNFSLQCRCIWDKRVLNIPFASHYQNNADITVTKAKIQFELTHQGCLVRVVTEKKKEYKTILLSHFSYPFTHLELSLVML